MPSEGPEITVLGGGGSRVAKMVYVLRVAPSAAVTATWMLLLPVTRGMRAVAPVATDTPWTVMEVPMDFAMGVSVRTESLGAKFAE